MDRPLGKLFNILAAEGAGRKGGGALCRALEEGLGRVMEIPGGNRGPALVEIGPPAEDVVVGVGLRNSLDRSISNPGGNRDIIGGTPGLVRLSFSPGFK